jgi:HK97 family phage portal protein
LTRTIGPVRALVQNVSLAIAESAGFPARQLMQRAFASVELDAGITRTPATNVPYGLAYQISPDVYACVSLVSQVAAGLELQIWTGEGRNARRLERKDGNALDLWRRPDKAGNATDFENCESLFANLLTFGTGYIYKDRMRKLGYNDSAVPQELTSLCAAHMSPFETRGREVTKWRYMDGRGAPVIYDARDVARVPMWSVDGNPEGLSPLSAARLRYMAQHNANLYIAEVWRTGGGMQGVISAKTPIGPEQEKAFNERLQERFRNVRKWLTPLFASGELKWDRTAPTLSDLEFVENAKLTTSDIAKIFKIPTDLLGVDKAGALTQASLEGAMLAFVEFCMKPLLKRVERALDERLWRDFRSSESEYLYCKFDRSGMLAVVKAYLDQAQAIVKVTGRPILKGNEGREKLGDEPISDDPSMDEVAKSAGPAAPAEGDGTGDPPAEPNAQPRAPQKNGGGRRRLWPADRLSRTGLRDAAELQTERAEARGFHLWTGIVDEQETRILTAVHGSALGARFIDSDIEAIVQLVSNEDERDEVRGFLQRLYEATGQANLDALKPRLLAQAAAFDMNALAVRRFLSEYANRAIDLPNETTKEMVRTAIALGVRSGDGIDGIANRVAEQFAARRNNLRTIARTEVIPALNSAALESYAQAGIVGRTEWATARDEIVRGVKGDTFSHRQMDGVVVALGELFHVPRIVGGAPEALRFPGDPKGSASNIINCRCRVVPVLADANEDARVIGSFRTSWFGGPSLNGRHHHHEPAR